MPAAECVEYRAKEPVRHGSGQVLPAEEDASCSALDEQPLKDRGLRHRRIVGEIGDGRAEQLGQRHDERSGDNVAGPGEHGFENRRGVAAGMTTT